jgi:hypothetical protein
LPKNQSKCHKKLHLEGVGGVEEILSYEDINLFSIAQFFVNGNGNWEWEITISEKIPSAGE